MRAICLVRLFAPPMCPDKTDTIYFPVLSIFTMAGSVCLSVINGAMERTQIPNDPTNTNASNLLKCSFKKVAMDGIVSVNIDSKLEYRFDPGRCFAIVRESILIQDLIDSKNLKLICDTVLFFSFISYLDIIRDIGKSLFELLDYNIK